MPWGDGTGPMGFGPMTGGGFGPCGRGFGRRGRSRGKGFGWRRMMDYPEYDYYEPEPLTKEEQKKILEEEMKCLEEELKAIRKKLSELK